MSEISIGGSTGLCSILFVVFLVLKLVGVITWSWWWVTCPLWIGFALVISFALIALMIGIGALGIVGWLNSKK